MSEAPEWIGAAEFASRFCIERRSATRALAKAIEGTPWRGLALEVRTSHSRGGRRGMAYEVSLRSLSEALGKSEPEFFPELVAATPRNLAVANQAAAIGKRWAALQAIVLHPARTAERAAAIAAAADAGQGLRRTLQRWAADYDREGYGGLGNRKPRNAGAQRVIVSRDFDCAFLAAGHAPGLLADIGGEVDQALKALWASRAQVPHTASNSTSLRG